MAVKPVFIFSLPRAGSTMLQRMLDLHDKIDTAPEPWVAIPLFYSLREDGVNAVYSHKVLSNAVRGFAESLPGGVEQYRRYAGEFLSKMYTVSSGNEVIYFVDKTPRYHLVIEDILQAFPDAKFIFLWRNPLAVAASIIKTWGGGKWNLYMFHVDLYAGLPALLKAYSAHKNAIAVRYEDIVNDPEKEMKRIMAYLDLDYTSGIAEKFQTARKINAPGRGDPTGQFRYHGLSSDSIDSWKALMCNPFRKKWMLGYLREIGHDNLATMGYDADDLIHQISEQPSCLAHTISDCIRSNYGKIYSKLFIHSIRNKKPCLPGVYFPES